MYRKTNNIKLYYREACNETRSIIRAMRHGQERAERYNERQNVKKKKKLLGSAAEASSATGTQKAERAELKVNDGGVPMYV